jgi:hypothetical protein
MELSTHNVDMMRSHTMRFIKKTIVGSLTSRSMNEKAKIYHNVWSCAYQRRYNAKVAGNWDLYDREHSTILMCLHIAKWTKFEKGA